VVFYICKYADYVSAVDSIMFCADQLTPQVSKEKQISYIISQSSCPKVSTDKSLHALLGNNHVSR
jgi:hypothetical protein